jgi:hypothetical protein
MISNKIKSYIQERKNTGKNITWNELWTWNAKAATVLPVFETE